MKKNIYIHTCTYTYIHMHTYTYIKYVRVCLYYTYVSMIYYIVYMQFQYTEQTIDVLLLESIFLLVHWIWCNYYFKLRLGPSLVYSPCGGRRRAVKATCPGPPTAATLPAESAVGQGLCHCCTPPSAGNTTTSNLALMSNICKWYWQQNISRQKRAKERLLP